MPGDENVIWRSAVFLGVVVDPSDGLGDVAGHFLDGHLGHEAIVDRHEHEALLNECLRLPLHTRLVTLSPTTTVEPYEHRMVLAIGRGIDIKPSAFVGGFRVGEVTVGLRLDGEGGRKSAGEA